MLRGDAADDDHAGQCRADPDERTCAEEPEMAGQEVRLEVDLLAELAPACRASIRGVHRIEHGIEVAARVGDGGECMAGHVGDNGHDPEEVGGKIGDCLRRVRGEYPLEHRGPLGEFDPSWGPVVPNWPRRPSRLVT